MVALTLSSLKLKNWVNNNERDWFNNQKLKIWCYLNHINYLSWFDRRKNDYYFFYSVLRSHKCWYSDAIKS